jgi:mersacidin/lichenicidin family type 2 lantibiotic
MSDGTDAQARKVIARAWRDQEYREELPAEVRERLPEPPDGASEMTDGQLEAAAGGTTAPCGAAALFAGGMQLGIMLSDKND